MRDWPPISLDILSCCSSFHTVSLIEKNNSKDYGKTGRRTGLDGKTERRTGLDGVGRGETERRKDGPVWTGRRTSLDGKTGRRTSLDGKTGRRISPDGKTGKDGKMNWSRQEDGICHTTSLELPRPIRTPPSPHWRNPEPIHSPSRVSGPACLASVCTRKQSWRLSVL